MQFSSQQLIFTYQPDKHLSTTLKIKNIQKFSQLYKFKISKANRFMIKPNMGPIQPNEEKNIDIAIHKDIVKNYQNQRVQILYGKNLEDGKNCKSMLFGIRVDGVQSDLNLTTMVESKLERIKSLETEVNNMKYMPQPTAEKKKSSKLWLKLIIVIILGLLIGYFGPLKIFKKKIIKASH